MSNTPVSSKKLSEKDASQALRLSFNDNDMTLSTAGFLDGKVGHRLKTLSPTSQLDNNYYYDELVVISAVFNNGSTVVSVPNTIGLQTGQTILLDVGLAGVPDLTTISSINVTTNQITMSASFTGSNGTYTLHSANLLKILTLYYNNATHDILLDAARTF
jgi:hypothetical protein